MLLEDRVCLVTGASGGIGQALCHTLAKAGARMVLTARDKSALDVLAASLPAASVVAVLAADQSDPAALQMLAADAAGLHVDTLINLAGTNQLTLFDDMSAQALSELVSLNLTAPMLLTHAMLPHLKTRRAALIVNIGSAFGAIGFPGYVAYSASKFGLRGFSEALARELQDTEIGVLYVAPRATDTKMNHGRADALNVALGNRTDSPQWVAQQIVRAMGKPARRLHLGWPERFFVWLNGWWPWLVDNSLARQLPVVRDHARDSNI